MPNIYGHSTTIYHNNDFTGKVILNVSSTEVEDANEGRVAVSVEFADLRTLVLAYLKQKMIENIVNMTEPEFEKFNVFGEDENDFELPTLGYSK